MPKAVFEQFIGDQDFATSDGIGVKAFFCVAGLSDVGQQEITVSFTIDALDTPLIIKRKLSVGIRDAVLAQFGDTMTDGDILLPDLTRGQIV